MADHGKESKWDKVKIGDKGGHAGKKQASKSAKAPAPAYTSPVQRLWARLLDEEKEVSRVFCCHILPPMNHYAQSIRHQQGRLQLTTSVLWGSAADAGARQGEGRVAHDPRDEEEERGGEEEVSAGTCLMPPAFLV